MKIKQAPWSIATFCFTMLVGPRQVIGQSPAPAQPSVRETGRVAKPAVTAPDLRIRDARAERAAPRELPIDKLPEPTARAPRVDSSGRIDQAVLARELRSRLAALAECPVDVARHKHIAAAAASTGRFLLRWTILPTGRVADTAVVAMSPVNVHVMDCVKRQMNGWSFTAPEGGSVRLERPFQFRSR